MKNRKVVVVSGGYDPLHVGHIRQMKEAKELGDVLVVMLNTDEWLIQKKGYIFMPFDERKEILESIKYVDRVIPVIDKGNTVAETLANAQPHIFAKGGDRTATNLPDSEKDVCRKLGIQIVYGVGGKKVQSSSWLIDKVRTHAHASKKR